MNDNILSTDIINRMKNREEVIWLNPNREHVDGSSRIDGYSFVHIKAAQNRFMRFLPYIASAFPETAAKKGVIESALLPIPTMKQWLNDHGAGITGMVLLKDDAHLPIAGSVKARGGIHQVLKIAEMLLQKGKLIKPTENYGIIDSPAFREYLGQFTIQVGSTGNLGLSIGRSAAKMGFQVIIHMSDDAKEWKKELLRSEGVQVKTYAGDYSLAVAKGREESAQDEKSFFIDDENSEDLFFGYATAALRLKVQLGKQNISVDAEHPLFVYLPCGVGGAPGGITFGLRMIFGDYVHCFFAEPVEAPCVTLGMATGNKEHICVQDIGLTGKTIADGLAVGRPSGLVCRLMETMMSGAFTVDDSRLPEYQEALLKTENIRIEPSACAGFFGLAQMEANDFPDENAFARYQKANSLQNVMSQATHIVWATGGGLMP